MSTPCLGEARQSRPTEQKQSSSAGTSGSYGPQHLHGMDSAPCTEACEEHPSPSDARSARALRCGAAASCRGGPNMYSRPALARAHRHHPPPVPPRPAPGGRSEPAPAAAPTPTTRASSSRRRRPGPSAPYAALPPPAPPLAARRAL